MANIPGYTKREEVVSGANQAKDKGLSLAETDKAITPSEIYDQMINSAITESAPTPEARSKIIENASEADILTTLEKQKNTQFASAATAIVSYGLDKAHQPISITPKPDYIAKVFLVPTWESTERNNITSGSALSSSIYSTTDFFLDSVSEQEAEKYQIIETFGDNKVYFYGSRPKVYTFSGRLLNSSSHQWKTSFINKYQTHLRGTKCAENKQRIYLWYDEVLAEGYILNLSINTSADVPNLCPFSFTMFITNVVRNGA